MNKQFKLIIKILLMIISGRYYYSILTNEYCYKFVDQKKIQKNVLTNPEKRVYYTTIRARALGCMKHTPRCPSRILRIFPITPYT